MQNDYSLTLPGTATREQRLERAQSVAANALERYGENVIAIGVYGSTARGSDEPYSDLEMAVVVRDPVGVRRYEFYLDGWKTEVECWQPDALLKYVRELDITWPIWGGQFLHVLSLYDPQNFWATLRAWIAEMPDEMLHEALREALVGEFLEHVSKYRNARLRGDASFMRWAAWQLAWDAVCIVGLANRTCYTSRVEAVRQSLALPLIPQGYSELIALFESGHLTDPGLLDERCERMVAGILAMGQALSIEFEVQERPI